MLVTLFLNMNLFYFLLVYINCTNRILCDIPIHAYYIL
jgi:hypothetical protein